MTGMEARRQVLMVVVIDVIIGLAMEEKWFCISITNKTEVLGLGFWFLIWYFL